MKRTNVCAMFELFNVRRSNKYDIMERQKVSAKHETNENHKRVPFTREMSEAHCKTKKNEARCRKQFSLLHDKDVSCLGDNYG